MDDNKLLQKLSQNLLEILNDDEYCDITIEVGDDPYVKIFRAHINILNYRSSYLRRILSTNKKKNDGTLLQIKLPNILPEIFQIILRYIYGGRLSLEEYDTSDIIKILVAASELSLQELVDYIQSFLTKRKADWMEQNFNLIYQTSFEKDSFLELKNYCTNLMSNNPNKIFKSLDFSTTPEKLLISLIQSDNLQMNEVQVWENVLKWGFAQNPGFPSDPSNFSKDDFNSLKNTLHQCIPSVRFYNLTSKEFFYNVVPYKKVLPKELYMDLLKTFLDPDSKPIDKPKPRKGTTGTSSQKKSASNYPQENEIYEKKPAFNYPQKKSASNYPQKKTASNYPQKTEIQEKKSAFNYPQKKSASNYPQKKTASNYPQKSSNYSKETEIQEEFPNYSQENEEEMYDYPQEKEEEMYDYPQEKEEEMYDYPQEKEEEMYDYPQEKEEEMYDYSQGKKKMRSFLPVGRFRQF